MWPLIKGSWFSCPACAICLRVRLQRRQAGCCFCRCAAPSTAHATAVCSPPPLLLLPTTEHVRTRLCWQYRAYFTERIPRSPLLAQWRARFSFSEPAVANVRVAWPLPACRALIPSIILVEHKNFPHSRILRFCRTIGNCRK